MTYIPANKIITNLLTNGTEYQTQYGVPYSGYYWKDFKNQVFTGKTPNDKPTQPLFPLSPSSNVEPLTPNTSYSLLEIDDLGEAGEMKNADLVREYHSINGIDFTKETKYLPTQYHPEPTPEDYQLGSFIRYFCVKINQSIYLEINEKTYKALTTKDESWSHPYYTPFKLQWTLTGNQKFVERANSNISKIAEKKISRTGFGRFLKFNYLKFYLP